MIKLENFRKLDRNSNEPARLGSPSPQRHLRTFRGPKALPLAKSAITAKFRSLCCPDANLAQRSGISNREHHLLEHLLTCRKQTTAARSNREPSTNQYCGISHVLIASPPSLTGSHRAPFAKGWVSPNASLPGTAQYVESDVTHSKQTTATFLAGARTAHRCFQVSSARRVYLHLATAISFRNPRA